MKPTNAMVFVLMLMLILAGSDGWAAGKKKAAKRKAKPKEDNITKIIDKQAFTDACVKLAEDERVPVASSTLVEKGRGEDYYNVEKLFDGKTETFWAEGAKGDGKNEWVAFHLPDETTHVEIVPGAGKEGFDNFNHPKKALLDVYLVRITRDKDTDAIKPKFKWLARATYKFKNKFRPVRQKLPIKLPELAMNERTMYVAVLILDEVYKGQFADTSIAEIRTTSVWGEN